MAETGLIVVLSPGQNKIKSLNIFAHKFQACADINLYAVLHGWKIIEPVKEEPPGDSDRS
jgi:hypothetical protein